MENVLFNRISLTFGAYTEILLRIALFLCKFRGNIDEMGVCRFFVC